MQPQKSIYSLSSVCQKDKLEKTIYGPGVYKVDTRKLVSLRIQQLCATHGYNINSLARKAGIPPTTLKNIIYGNSRNPGIVTIKLVCDGLEISLYDFFDTEAFRNTELEDLE